ncbi:MAG: septum formation initiator family protein [Acidobacteriota bacterium]
MTNARNAPTDRKTGPLLRAAVVVFLLLLTAAGLQSWRELSLAREHEARLDAEIATTGQRIEALREEIRRVEDDPATLERLAREQLGWVRDGDLVVVLPDDTVDDSPRDGSPAADGNRR